MRARRSPAAKFEAELCAAKAQRRHQLSTACKMQVKVVPRRLAAEDVPSILSGKTSHALQMDRMPTGFSKYLGPDAQQLKREVQHPIKKEEVALPYVKEEDDITMSSGEPSNGEDGPSEVSRGTQPQSGSSSSTEGHIFIAPSDRKGTTSHSPYKDGGQKKSHGDGQLCKCSQSLIVGFHACLSSEPPLRPG
ncbi:uncharacterized protein LOC130927668 isoform X3 [Corythoichthys intestinalis]|uniref:uncharacterized protein LOC130927668 isoform X3 n=1 Tax=Corythoichthys intestinalis TaxID=161448 RepID=UPI0025A4CE94|nr:uncharacterized protein LOC130927668 isoform X3 [Corythoichthys intestinalis]